MPDCAGHDAVSARVCAQFAGLVMKSRAAVDHSNSIPMPRESSREMEPARDNDSFRDGEAAGRVGKSEIVRDQRSEIWSIGIYGGDSHHFAPPFGYYDQEGSR